MVPVRGAKTASALSKLQFPELTSDLHAACSYSVISPAKDPATPWVQRRQIGDYSRSDLVSAGRAQAPGSVRAMLVVRHGVLIHDRVQVPSSGAEVRSVTTSARAVRSQRPA